LSEPRILKIKDGKLMQTKEKMALNILNKAINTPPEECPIIDNISAKELICLVQEHILTCPKCGAEAWVNIDCDLCNVVAVVTEEYRNS
jgi:hypothetical protein